MADFRFGIILGSELNDSSFRSQASYDLNVHVGGSALIASFSLKVQNKELIDQDQWVAGQTRFNGTQSTQLEDPDKSATVSFSISSNEGWTAADADVLRGQRRFDEVSFSNL
jgi:hypothetical protein